MTTTTPEATRAPTGPVQIIALLVDKADPASHHDAIHAAALASVNAYAEGRPDGDPREDAWTHWLSGSFTKSVRRADAKTFAKLTAEFGQPVATVGKAQAMAFKPMPYEELPKTLARLQVSGTNLPVIDSERERPAHAATIVLNSALGMTTGKAAAQASHALMAWYLALEPEARREWLAAGTPSAVRFAPAGPFESTSQWAIGESRIRDNGLTEIAPGTMTAYVIV
jgi:peptidyl-tRNA hydrolase